jgi:hypothetical protein
MMYKILGDWWCCNSLGNMGVVAIETFEVTGEWKAYMGICNGDDVLIDQQMIAAYGNGLSPEIAHAFFPYLDVKRYKKDDGSSIVEANK